MSGRNALIYYNHYKDGVSEGFESGATDTLNKTILSTLKNNIDINTISNKSTEEIKLITENQNSAD